MRSAWTSTTLTALLVWSAVLPSAVAWAAPRAGGAARPGKASKTSLPATPRDERPDLRLLAPKPRPDPADDLAPTRIMPLSEVRPGMIGEALTVFQGTKPEPFKVRVISIMHNFLPKQDVILIRAEDPRLEFSGIVAGMSGSPVYVEGRLMGAIAYGWSFSKEPLGGVTPIETMLAERSRPRRASGELLTTTDAAGLRTLTLGEGGPNAPRRPTGGQPTPPSQAAFAAAPPAGSEPHLVRASVPLSVSGFDPRVLADFASEFRAEGLVPVQGAGGGRPRVRGAQAASSKMVERSGPSSAAASGNGRLVPGSAIGIELVRGDMSMVGTGTVTHVDRDGVLAFGHPMFGAGEIYLPLVDAEIHAILPSVSQSMKLSSPLREIGALVQDRQSCVVGDLGARASMVPITVRVTGPGAEPRVFRAEVARNRRLTPTLAALVVTNALTDAEPDVAEMVVRVASKLTVRGRAPIELRDEIFAPEGVSRQSLAGTRGMRAMSELLSNPFEPVVLDGLDVEVRVDYRRDVAEIVALSLPGEQVRPGQKVALRVTLRPYSGPEYTETVPVVIPAMLAGDTVRIEVASGSVAKPDSPVAETLSIYLENLGRYFPPTALVVGVQTAHDGASLHGRLLPDLPASAADTLRPGNQTRRADGFRVVERSVHQTPRLIVGRQELTVHVRHDVLGAAILR